MASSGDIRAGRAYVELGVNDNLEKGLRKAQKRLKDFAAGVEEVGKKLLLIGAMMALPFTAGAKVFADFEQQMAMVSTMLDAPDQHMEQFSEGIRKMAVRFGEDTGTMAKGLYDLLSASVAPAQALGVLEVAIKAAKAGMTDTATSVAALVNVMNAFHIPASRMIEVSDMLFMTVKRGVTTFAELAEHIGMVTATASAAGMKMDDLGASLATMTRNGLKTDIAVTAMNNILSEFLKPTADGAAAAKKLGINFSVAGLQADGFASIMEKLAKADPTTLAKIFPDARGLRGILAIRGDIAGFLKDVKLFEGKAGSTAAAYEKMSGLLWQYFNRIREAGKELLVIIGEALEKDLKHLGETILTVAEASAVWLKQHKDMILTLAKVVVGVLAAGSAMIGLAMAIKVAAGILGILTVMFSPVTLALAAVSAMILAIYANTYDLGKTFSGLAEIFGQAFQGIKDAIAAGDLSQAFEIVTITISLLWQKLVLELVNVWDGFVTGFLLLIGSAGKTCRQIFFGLSGNLITSWITVKNWFAQFWEWLYAGFQKLSAKWDAFRGTINKDQLVQRIKDIEFIKTTNQRTEEAKSAAELDKHEAEMDRRLNQSDDEYFKDITDASQARMAPYEKAVEKAKQDLRDALDQAAAASTGKQIDDTLDSWYASLPGKIEQLQAAVPVLNAQLGKSAVNGTFYAQAFQSLQSDGTAERTAKAAEKTADNTDEMKRTIKNMKSKFA